MLKSKKVTTRIEWEKSKTEKITLAPIAGLTIEDMMEHYSMQYPEMATSSAKAPYVDKNGVLVYEIVNTLGTKG